MSANHLEQRCYKSNIGLAIRPVGRHGCLARATPARLYGQFANMAMSILLYDFVVVKHLFYTIDELDDDDGNMLSEMSSIYSTLYEDGLVIDPVSIVPEDLLDCSPAALRGASLFASCSDETFEKLTEEHQSWREARGAYAEVGKKIGDPDLYEFPEFMDMSNFVTAKHYQFKARSYLSDVLVASYLRNAGYEIDETPFDGQIPYQPQLRPDIQRLKLPLHPEPEPSRDDARLATISLDGVPFPKTLSANAIKTFKQTPVVRDSIAKVRALVGEFAHPQGPEPRVIEDFNRNFAAYKREIQSLSQETCLCDLRFRFPCADEDHADALKFRFTSGLCDPFGFQAAKFSSNPTMEEDPSWPRAVILEIQDNTGPAR